MFSVTENEWPGPTDSTHLDRFTVVEALGEEHVEQLHHLIQQQWWGGNRSLDDVRVMVENTRLMIGLVERKTGRLVGYCRAITDFVFRATIYDVMVVQDLQGTGLGKRLMEQICQHPRLQRVSIMYLACEPALAPFYSRWGFRAYDERAQWMIKVQREE